MAFSIVKVEEEFSLQDFAGECLQKVGVTCRPQAAWDTDAFGGVLFAGNVKAKPVCVKDKRSGPNVSADWTEKSIADWAKFLTGQGIALARAEVSAFNEKGLLGHGS